MKNQFCNHTPIGENIKEVTNELRLLQNVHLLACDINDVKVILDGATNNMLVESFGNGSGRLSKALKDAVTHCCKIAKGYDSFSANKLLLQVKYNSLSPLLDKEVKEIRTFMDMFEKKDRFFTSVSIDYKNRMNGNTIIIRILASNLTLK